jgi:hypothetical protein
VPEKSNIWRDCVDGMYDWVKEHIAEARSRARALCVSPAHALTRHENTACRCNKTPASPRQGAPLNESDHCGDPPLLLAAGNGARPQPRRTRRAAATLHAPPPRFRRCGGVF